MFATAQARLRYASLHAADQARFVVATFVSAFLLEHLVERAEKRIKRRRSLSVNGTPESRR